MPRFPVGNLANINLAAPHGWNFGAALLIQDLDTPYSGSDEIPNPDGRRTRQQTLLLQAEFGLTDRWALGATLPLRHAKAEGRTDLDTSGLGDIEVLLRYAAFPMALGRLASLNLLGGIGLPTGRSEGMLAAQENIQFGVGNFTAVAGFEWSYRARPGITAFLRSRAGWVLGANDDGYRFGDSFDNAAGATFLLRSPNLRIITYVSTLHLEQDRQDGEPVQSRGGRWIYGAVGLHATGVGQNGAIAITLQRLIDVDVRGDQLVSPWNLFMGYDIRLPGHQRAEHDGSPGHVE